MLKAAEQEVGVVVIPVTTIVPAKVSEQNATDVDGSEEESDTTK